MAENTGSLPFVSVFVPARNEEAGLENCLKSLLSQDYAGGWELLFADDASSDDTLAIALRLSERHKKLRVFSVEQGEGRIQGKQRALAQLGERARGDVFLFCDADMEVPQGWLREMVVRLQRGNASMINGSSCPAGSSLFAGLQALDWLIPQMAMGLAGKMGLAFTAMGNNMGITRNAYDAVGGYGSIPASITEDYELYRQASARGFSLIHYFEPAVLASTRPAESPGAWFSQHLRWTSGFMQLPPGGKIPKYLSLLLLPLLLFSAGLHQPLLLKAALVILLLKWIFIATGLFIIRKPALLLLLPLYECLYYPAYYSLFLASFFRKNLEWKGRKVRSS